MYAHIARNEFLMPWSKFAMPGSECTILDTGTSLDQDKIATVQSASFLRNRSHTNHALHSIIAEKVEKENNLHMLL